MNPLFEFGQWEQAHNIETLKESLHSIWAERYNNDSEFEISESDYEKKFQPFLKFDGQKIKAQNYVGFIKNEFETIEIYPKVFRNLSNAITNKDLMLRHIFYWFKYCRRWRFPFNQVSLDTISIDEFPELIINLIANEFLDTVSKLPLTMYQLMEEPLQTPRGSINFKRYINNSFTHGNLHHIECDYEPFLFDNKVNRIIKYCTRLLMKVTKFPENLQLLQEIIFILDDVEDIPCTIHDVNKIQLNPIFENYLLILDSSRLILSNQLYSNNPYDISQWCLLFPMEYIFEDFVAGFLESEFSTKWKIEYQKQEMYLCNTPCVFKMQHDIFLSDNNSRKKIIIDTKYKLRDNNFKSDPKRGISQSDLYQMTSYAFKRGCSDVVLIYPNVNEIINTPDKFEIISNFPAKEKIKVTAIEIPFWSFSNFEKIHDFLYSEIATQIGKILN